VGSSEEDRELMSAADVSRTISRIAHQIIEKTALDDAAGAPHRVRSKTPRSPMAVSTALW
jgi:pyrimidine operon attenuation protein/uracil phosphoribosyltransferase